MKAGIKKNGFSLIELVVVISILGILAFILVNVLQGPAKAYYDVQRRVQLVDIVETALHRMTREIRLALPNSVRVSTGNEIEFLRTRDGGRYRNQGANRLKFNKQTDTFEFLGPLNEFTNILTGGSGQSDCMAASSGIDCMVVFNTGQTGADAYAGDNIAAVTNKSGSTLTFNLSPVSKFPYQSPRQRFFIVDTPVSFICSGANVTRYDDYLIQSTQPTSSSLPSGGSANLLINQVSSCNISYNPGTATRSGLVTVSLTVSDSQLGQSITLMQQAHVDNQP